MSDNGIGEESISGIEKTSAMLPESRSTKCRLDTNLKDLSQLSGALPLPDWDELNTGLHLSEGGRVTMLEMASGPYHADGPSGVPVQAKLSEASLEGGPDPELSLASGSAPVAWFEGYEPSTRNKSSRESLALAAPEKAEKAVRYELPVLIAADEIMVTATGSFQMPSLERPDAVNLAGCPVSAPWSASSVRSNTAPAVLPSKQPVPLAGGQAGGNRTGSSSFAIDAFFQSADSIPVTNTGSFAIPTKGTVDLTTFIREEVRPEAKATLIPQHNRTLPGNIVTAHPAVGRMPEYQSGGQEKRSREALQQLAREVASKNRVPVPQFDRSSARTAFAGAPTRLSGVLWGGLFGTLMSAVIILSFLYQQALQQSRSNNVPLARQTVQQPSVKVRGVDGDAGAVEKVDSAPILASEVAAGPAKASSAK